MDVASFFEGIGTGILLVFVFVYALGRYIYYKKPRMLVRRVMPMLMARKRP